MRIVLQYGYIFQWEPSEYDPDEWDQAYRKNGTTFYTGQVRRACGAASPATAQQMCDQETTSLMSVSHWTRESTDCAATGE